MARIALDVLRRPRGSNIGHAAIRLAAEGIPLTVIARGLNCPRWEVEYACQEAVSKGVLTGLPPRYWPKGQSRVPDRLPKPCSVELPAGEVADLARRLEIALGLRHGSAILLAAMVTVGIAEKSAMRDLVARRSGRSMKLVEVSMFFLRRDLAVYGIEVQTIWGAGYRLAPGGRQKVLALLDARSPKAEDRNAA